MINKIFKKITNHPYIASIACGMILAIPLSFQKLFLLSYVSVFLFFGSLLRNEDCKKQFFRRILMFFLGYYFVLYNWFTALYPLDSVDMPDNLSILAIILGWIILSTIHSLIMSIAFIPLKYILLKKSSENPNKTKIGKLLSNNFFLAAVTASLWLVGETLTEYIGGFQWSNIAMSQMAFLPFIQTASLFGKGIITLVVVFSSVLTACAFLSNDKKYIIKTIAVAMAVIVVNTTVGMVLFLLPVNSAGEKNVLMIQGNVLSGDKWDANNKKDIIDRHFDAMEQNLKNNKYDIVVFAETVFPSLFIEGNSLCERLRKTAAEYNVDILFGAIVYEDDKQYNSAFIIHPDGVVSERYDKQKLVPFGEYIPFESLVKTLLPFTEHYFGSAFTSGTESKAIECSDGTTITPIVCFDSVYSTLSRDGVAKGAQAIAIITNDSWYKDSNAIYQHLNHARLRAIETGRSVLRCANTGISCVIDYNGRVNNETKPLIEAIVSDTYSLNDHITLYVKCGSISVYLALFTTLTVIICLYKDRKKKI